MPSPSPSAPRTGRPSEPPGAPGARRRADRAIFLILFAAYAYFHQGGGWNQNSRFDQVRAIVEAGVLSIDRYAQNTGDTSAYAGHVYPNKPPGATFLAVPAYWIIHRLERILGVDPDGWWPLTVNAWLTTVFSVGLLGALGGVVLHRLSLRLFPAIGPGRHAAAALTFGLGTMILPFGTSLFDHVPVAVFSLLAFHLALGERPRRGRLVAAGFCAGMAVLCNYAAAFTAILIAAYVAWAARPRRSVVYFLDGGIVPAIVLGWYHRICFGRELAIANAYQSGLFIDERARWLGVFDLPDPVVLIKLLVSPYRGLFFTSPVLLLAAYGLWRMGRDRATRREAALCAAVTAVFLLLNASFHAWHAGFSFGPRYLIPAIPFLAAPLALAFDRLPRTGAVLAALSAALMLLATAVDPQVPFQLPNPVTGYLLPLAAGDRAARPPFRPVEGPVSANTQGMYEKYPDSVYGADSQQAEWNSFNLGEFLAPRSWMSLAPLLLVLAGGLWAVFPGFARPATRS
jgi:hypothetical protein